MSSISNTNLTLISLLFFSFVVSLLINYILLKFARTLGIRARVSTEIRWDPKHKPSLGGISFYLSFLFSFIFLALINPDFSNFRWTVFGFLLASSLAFLMGLADDAFNTQPLLKLITQIVCSLILVYSGIHIRLFENILLNYGLTIFWIIGMMNSFNLIDNMDGITGIISVVICAFFVAVSVSLKIPNSYITIFNVCVLGAVVGFLVYNFHPSKMYMGDSGSQFIGFFLAAIGIEVCWNSGLPFGLYHGELENITLVLLVYILPIIDTTTVFINRIARGTSPFVGGKDHTTHHLYFKGVTEKRIAALYFLISVIACVLAYNITFNFSYNLLYFSLIFVAIVFLFLYLNTIIRKRT
jgi:UDP-GlcNAc:undecaprenyl-phosphate/decaprenyl-phosphate GlcNAc-1-phosphate transferase